ncbi:hypothetical protein EYF80_052928 [Liparis tanakae]|uniref:Uncharacterized protein n=1 Tax=Liparis tanakae TaxID=230148 RepID=A0A4Z2F7C7_9TELE|nr:hypothetical protein EYF80_052928 [Liparis tanakae]
MPQVQGRDWQEQTQCGHYWGQEVRVHTRSKHSVVTTGVRRSPLFTELSLFSVLFEPLLHLPVSPTADRRTSPERLVFSAALACWSRSEF